jgi:hypothetical protein
MLGDELAASHEIGHTIKVFELGLFFMNVELNDNGGGGTRYDAQHEGDPIPVLDEIKICLAGYVGQCHGQGITPTLAGFEDDPNCSGDREHLHELLGERYDQFVPYMASELATYSNDLDGPFAILFDIFTGALIERRKFYGDEIQEVLSCYLDHNESTPQVRSPAQA